MVGATRGVGSERGRGGVAVFLYLKTLPHTLKRRDNRYTHTGNRLQIALYLRVHAVDASVSLVA